MSSVEGKLLTCDVCGKSIFLKCVGRKEAHGGYTKWREYENADGWTNVYFGNVKLQNVCPRCDELLQNALLECIGKIK